MVYQQLSIFSKQLTTSLEKNGMYVMILDDVCNRQLFQCCCTIYTKRLHKHCNPSPHQPNHRHPVEAHVETWAVSCPPPPRRWPPPGTRPDSGCRWREKSCFAACRGQLLKSSETWRSNQLRSMTQGSPKNAQMVEKLPGCSSRKSNSCTWM